MKPLFRTDPKLEACAASHQVLSLEPDEHLPEDCPACGARIVVRVIAERGDVLVQVPAHKAAKVQRAMTLADALATAQIAVVEAKHAFDAGRDDYDHLASIAGGAMRKLGTAAPDDLQLAWAKQSTRATLRLPLPAKAAAIVASHLDDDIDLDYRPADGGSGFTDVLGKVLGPRALARVRKALVELFHGSKLKRRGHAQPLLVGLAEVIGATKARTWRELFADHRWQTLEEFGPFAGKLRGPEIMYSAPEESELEAEHERMLAGRDDTYARAVARVRELLKARRRKARSRKTHADEPIPF